MILDDLGLADRFDALVTGEDVAHGKPDPEGFVVAARRLGVDVERAASSLKTRRPDCRRRRRPACGPSV